MGRIDWRTLRGSIVLFAFALAFGAVAADSAIRFHQEALRDYERQKGRLETVRSRYRTIDAQRRLVETWLPAYLALRADGIIGEERRLEWIEALREVASRVGLPSLRYRMEPRTVYETGLEPEVGAHRPFSTVVRLEAGLLHEGDFERLIRDLATRSAGLYRVERCDVRRAGPDFVMRPGAINLAAECDLRWITLARIEAQQ